MEPVCSPSGWVWGRQHPTDRQPKETLDRAHRGHLPRAMRSTRMMRMMVGLMGRAAFISISSSAMPMMDRRTMAKSSWFHLASHG